MSLTLHRQSILESENQILAAVAQGTPTAAVLNKIVETLEAISGDVLGSILGLRVETQQLHILSAPNLPKAYNEAIEGLVIGDGIGSCGTAAFRGTPIVVEDILQHPFWKDFRGVATEHGLRACWSTPILSSTQQVLGTFACYYREPKLPTDLEWELMSRLGHLAAIVLEREQSQIQYQSKTSIDQDIVENAAEAILVVARSGRILKTNPHCRHLFGYKDKQLDGKNFGELFLDANGCLSLLEQTKHQAAPSHRIGRTLKTKSGCQLDAELLVTHLTEERILIVVHDRSNIPSPEHKSDQGKEIPLLEKLAYCTAAELNQSLASITSHRDLLATQLANHPELGATCHASLSQILTATQAAAKTTNQLMAFAKQLALRLRSVDLSKLFADALIELRSILSSNASFEIKIKPGVSGIWADERALCEVFSLLTRQAKQNNQAPQTVVLAARNGGQAERTIIELSYSPSDLGSSNSKTLLEPFTQKSGENLSTGLDLATARNIIRQMHGSIKAIATPEKTITFEISLPSEPCEPSRYEPAMTSEGPSPPRVESVLVCEDNEAIRLAVEGLLRASGYRVIVASSGEEALTAAANASDKIGVLVSDIRMPGMDGKTLSLKLRESQPELQVILVSGHTGGLVSDDWLEREKIAFLPKPFSHQALIQAVSKAFADYHSIVGDSKQS